MAHIPEVSEHDESQHMSVLIEQIESSDAISLVSWDSKKTTLHSNTAAQPEALKHLAVLKRMRQFLMTMSVGSVKVHWASMLALVIPVMM